MSFPATRLRRLRRTDALRALVRETSLSLDDVVMPLFACPGEGIVRPVAGLSGIAQRSVDELAREAGELARLGVRAVLLFGIPESKDAEGSGAWDDDGIVQRALRALSAEAPGLTLADRRVPLRVHRPRALRPARRRRRSTTTRRSTCWRGSRSATWRRAPTSSRPSDMMDGRVGAIRAALDPTRRSPSRTRRSTPRPSTARSARPRSPRRSSATGAGYQMDPANGREALRECALDLEEGADVLMVKPALAYLDVVRAVKERFDCPVAGVPGVGRVRDGAARPPRRDTWTSERQRSRRSPRSSAQARGRSSATGQGPRRVALSQRTDRWRRATSLIPGGVELARPRDARRRARRACLRVPRRGAWIEDAEGRRLLDWVQSWGPLVFGHADPETVAAVRAAAGRGTTFGAATELEVDSLPRSSTPSLRSRWFGSSAPAPRRR